MAKPITKLTLKPLEAGSRLKSEYRLGREGASFGRHPSNDIMLPFESVSRFHAAIRHDGNHFYVEDLKSSNGTFINGDPVKQAEIFPGMLLTFGNVSFKCYAHDSTVGFQKQQDDTSRQVEILNSNEQRILSQTSMRPSSAGRIAQSDAPTNIRELKQAHRQLRVLYKLVETLSAPLSDAELLTNALGLVHQAVAADRGVIMTRDHFSGELHTRAFVGHGPDQAGDSQLLISRTIVDACLNNQIAILVKDAQSDARFEAAASVFEHQIRSAICAPLLTNHRVLGLLFLDTHNPNHYFDEESLAFVSSCATEIAHAMELRDKRAEILRNTQVAAVGETVLNLAHGIKNILLVSEGGISLLDQALGSGSLEEARDCWLAVSSTLGRISTLVRDMLDYSRKWKPKLQRVRLNELIAEICTNCRSDVEAEGIQLIIKFDERIEQVRLDIEALRQSMENLLLNACEAIEHNEGRILIETQIAPENTFKIIVSDNGPGIALENIEQVFIPRFSTKGEKGSGLGLATVKKFMLGMGGDITVDSIPGQGATFTMILPIDEKTVFEV